MMEVGRLVVKIAGRDAGKRGIEIDVIDKNYVMVDGEVRRKKVNIKHLEPHTKVLNIKKGASDEDVVTALNEGKT